MGKRNSGPSAHSATHTRVAPVSTPTPRSRSRTRVGTEDSASESPRAGMKQAKGKRKQQDPFRFDLTDEPQSEEGRESGGGVSATKKKRVHASPPAHMSSPTAHVRREEKQPASSIQTKRQPRPSLRTSGVSAPSFGGGSRDVTPPRRAEAALSTKAATPPKMWGATAKPATTGKAPPPPSTVRHSLTPLPRFRATAASDMGVADAQKLWASLLRREDLGSTIAAPLPLENLEDEGEWDASMEATETKQSDRRRSRGKKRAASPEPAKEDEDRGEETKEAAPRVSKKAKREPREGERRSERAGDRPRKSLREASTDEDDELEEEEADDENMPPAATRSRPVAPRRSPAASPTKAARKVHASPSRGQRSSTTSMEPSVTSELERHRAFFEELDSQRLEDLFEVRPAQRTPIY